MHLYEVGFFFLSIVLTVYVIEIFTSEVCLPLVAVCDKVVISTDH